MTTITFRDPTVHKLRWLPFYMLAFTSFILIFMQPFAISNEANSLFFALFLMGYGVLDALVMYLILPLLDNQFKKRTIRRLFKFLIAFGAFWMICATTNFLYANFLHIQVNGHLGIHFAPKSFIDMAQKTFLMMIIPFGTIPVFALMANPGMQKVLLKSEYGNDWLRMPADSIVLLKSEDNYVSVYYLDQQGKLTRKLIRTTLKYVTLGLDIQFYRCHKSYMVNTAFVTEVTGGANIHLQHYPESVPLSRRRQKEFTQLLALQLTV